jgi:hypothetical protein
MEQDADLRIKASIHENTEKSFHLGRFYCLFRMELAGRSWSNGYLQVFPHIF